MGHEQRIGESDFEAASKTEMLCQRRCAVSRGQTIIMRITMPQDLEALRHQPGCAPCVSMVGRTTQPPAGSGTRYLRGGG